ncbi:MAG TPA: NAD(P)-binding domain-containing protein [Candidatus Solibacter sp.]|jgi:putative flavoprotein involved in K+ transport|nr:NAD(P)-binding domain-containing protein [Candidatus Solibacter sp.]
MTLAREDVVVIGAGQAGLATSYELTQLGVDHVVLERGRVGQSWRDRWDSFCLVLPNWTLKLPGHEFAGDDPDAFLPRDGIVQYLEAYAGKAGRIREGINVTSLEAAPDGGFVLRTEEGEIQARMVVLSTGAYQRPHRPPAAGTLPAGMHVIDAEGYTNPGALPEGGVLVVGSGQTGCQIAEEVQQSGRETFLACGKAPWIPRRIGERDTIAWVTETPFFEQPVSALPSPLAKLTGNPQASGRDGGHDLHFRTLQAIGVQLLGRFDHADESRVYFAADLAESVAFGDSRYADIKGLIHAFCKSAGISPPEIADPPAFDATAPESIELSRLGTVVFTSGFRPDYSRWVNIPTFDEMGFPLHHEGQSTVAPGLFFVGVHFLRKRKSSTLLGVGEDAGIVANQLAP